MRAAAVHLCFIDSGHPSLNRCQVLRHALSKQDYDRKAPVDLQLIRSSGTTIARPTSRWFSSSKNSPFSLKQGLRSDDKSGWQAKNKDVLSGQ